MPPTTIGRKNWLIRYTPTPRVAVARLNPKPTSVGMYTHSTIPSPPGVIGITPITLANPKATNSASGSSVPPNARRNTHSDEASSTQARAANEITRLSSCLSSKRSSTRTPTCRTAAVALSSSKRNFLAIARMIRSARLCPWIRPTTTPTATIITTMPARAATTYSPLAPRIGIEISRANHSMTLSTTAEPMPAVAMANPASAPRTPESVSSR